jgi:TonB family protein
VPNSPLLFLTCCSVMAQVASRPARVPDEFVIGRHTFVDFGPPLDFYAVFRVRSAAGGSLVERVEVTPPGDPCNQPATVEVATASISESVEDLLGKINVCAIPEKDLRRERKRCKKCLVFSGANVVMQIQCRNQTRRIRMDILDRDMFDPSPRTPEHTSWTMTLLGRLDRALGEGVMDRPLFALNQPDNSRTPLKPAAILEELSNGTFDSMFERAPDKPSELFREAQKPPPIPSVDLVSSTPVRPTLYEAPKYPQLAKMAHVDGEVVLTFDVGLDGSTSNVRFVSGHPLLRASVESAVATWKFGTGAASQEIRAAIAFRTNCSVKRP